MDRQEMLRILRDLAQIDVDCSLAYGQALDRLEPPLRDQLTRFRQDHEHHLAAISTALRQAEEDPPERARHLRGVLLETFATLRGLTGAQGALEAMRACERLSRREYEEACGHELPAEVRDLLENHRADETMHLNWTEQTLRNRGWE